MVQIPDYLHIPNRGRKRMYINSAQNLPEFFYMLIFYNLLQILE